MSRNMLSALYSSVITHEFSIEEIERAIQTAAVTDHALNGIINFGV